MIAILEYTHAQDCVIEQVTDKILSCKCYFNEEHRAFYIVSKAGLVLIDTYYFPWLTKESNDLVYSKTGRSDYIYLINTHGHGCHIGGNYLFNNIPRIGHENIVTNIRKTRDFHQKKYNEIKELVKKDSTKANELNEYEMLVNIPYPTMTFKDSMRLDLDDMVIKLVYFGYSGHSNDETLIFIPQEKTLIIGQILGASHFLPVVKDNCTQSDLQRKIDILSSFILSDINHILSNHQGEIAKEDFIFARDYLVDLSNDIKQFKMQGLSLDEIKKRFQLNKKYSELAKRHEITDELTANNNNNISSVWNMINKNSN